MIINTVTSVLRSVEIIRIVTGSPMMTVQTSVTSIVATIVTIYTLDAQPVTLARRNATGEQKV